MEQNSASATMASTMNSGGTAQDESASTSKEITEALSLPTTSNPNAIQSSRPVVDAGNTSYFVASQPSSETVAKIEQWKKQDRKVWSILSIIATIIPIILWVYCLIVSGGSQSENGPGAVWWLVVMYYWSLGIPLAVISIKFGIAGLKTSLRWLSIISLLLKATMIIAIVFAVVRSLV